jgi:Spy/CpxP family protein refolding chaperone
MKRYGYVVLGALLLGLAAAPVLAAEEGAEQKPKKRKKQPKPKTVLRGEYLMLSREAELSAEQKTELEGLVKAHQAELAAWNSVNAEKLKELKQELAQAKKDKDKEAVAAVRKKMSAIQKERAGLREGLWKKINAMLTDEQKAKYEAFKLYRGVARRYGRAKLTDAQKATVKEMVAQAQKDVAAAADRKAKAKVLNALHARIAEEVLTPEQREAMSKKRPKADRGKRADEKREKRHKRHKASGDSDSEADEDAGE